MKKFLGVLLSAAALFSAASFAGCANDAIIVQTNAFFAPFEYYEDSEIVGVDVDIMNRVGERLGRDVVFQDGDFSVIIDVVSQGRTADVGAAGITITPSRQEKVDFSIPYYTSVQYVIWDTANPDFTTQKAADGTTDIVLWSQLGGKDIGVQLDTTGNLYVEGEINGDEGYDGVLVGTGAECHSYDNAQMAIEAMYGSDALDCVVVDELPATFLTENTKNHSLKCAALYYDSSTATQEQYAICVTPGNTELLDAINAVLTEMLENDEIEKLVSQHLGLE